MFACAIKNGMSINFVVYLRTYKIGKLRIITLLMYFWIGCDRYFRQRRGLASCYFEPEEPKDKSHFVTTNDKIGQERKLNT